MITNNTVTILRYSKGAEKYETIGTCEAWSFLKRAISNSINGDKNDDVYHIRIRKENIEEVKVGDFVYVGAFEGKEPNLADCRRITSILNNDFGTIPHWHIEVEA